jgi:EamA domain-containing membrane protein RarD
MSARAPDALRRLGALATIVVGAVHLQQYADFIRDVPTIGVLFLLNAAGAGAVAILLATRRATLAAVGAIALSAGALVSIAISMTDRGLFDYTEPTLRAPVAIAVVAEVAAIALLLAYLLVRRMPSRAPRVDWSAR